MKKAAMILAIIGGLLGFFGGIITIGCAGCGESARQVDIALKGQNPLQEDSTKLIAKAGITGIVASLLGIVFGAIGGFANSKSVILITSILLLITGVIAFIVANYFSGPLLVIAGILGIVGSGQTSAKIS